MTLHTAQTGFNMQNGHSIHFDRCVSEYVTGDPENGYRGGCGFAIENAVQSDTVRITNCFGTRIMWRLTGLTVPTHPASVTMPGIRRKPAAMDSVSKTESIWQAVRPLIATRLIQPQRGASYGMGLVSSSPERGSIWQAVRRLMAGIIIFYMMTIQLTYSA
jgi:hypothetical protein